MAKGKVASRGLLLMLLLIGWVTTAQAVIPASERQVLIDLYNSTNGANWTNNTGWLGAVGTECSWYGITCDSTQSHVTNFTVFSYPQDCR